MTALELQQCCGSKAWVRAMEKVPSSDVESFVRRALQEWTRLSEADWLEAFSHHPEIGDLDSLRKKFQSTAHLAGGEQGQVRDASEAILKKLQQGNKAYREKFGFIFIVCATGKSAEEMLALLESRLRNDRATELKNAAAEQAKITELRLRKLWGEKA